MIDLRHGDCRDVLPTLAAGSVDAVVSDPPAGIAFMGQDWDDPDTFPLRDRGKLPGGPLPQQTPHKHERGFANGMIYSKSRKARDAFIDFMTAVMAECLRVARPGAHALVWSLPRTSHWTATAIEDAGWIIEDRIAHIFGTGFPKHKSKLKPAVEDWWLATKPGGAKWLGVDACRVGTDVVKSCITDLTACHGNKLGHHDALGNRPVIATRENVGRYPSNLLFTHHPDCRPAGTRRVKGSNVPSDLGLSVSMGYQGNGSGTEKRAIYADADGMEVVAAWECAEGCPIKALDIQAGERVSGKAGPNGHRRNRPPPEGIYGNGKGLWDEAGDAGHLYGDSGSASRFFPQFCWQESDFAPYLYCAKASRSERADFNNHPTVKPLQLMKWLCRLCCPPGGTILDPFAGSGTTLLAAEAEGFSAIGIESDPAYHAIALRRLAEARAATPLFDAPAAAAGDPAGAA